MNGYKVTLWTEPIVLKKSVTVFNEVDPKNGRKLPPHTREHPDTLEYRADIKAELAEQFDGEFKCPVRIHFDFYMPSARPTYVTGVAYEIVRALVPAFIQHHKFIITTSETIHYPPKKASLKKQWKPRTEIKITPMGFEVE